MTVIRFGLATITISALVAAAGCSGSDSGGDTVELQVGHVFPSSSPIHTAAVAWAKDVETQTDGRVTPKIFPSSQLGSDADMGEGLKTGTTACAMINYAASGIDTKLQLSFMPYIVTDDAGADKLFYGDGYVAAHDRKILKDLGVETIAFYENDFRGLSNNKHAVTKPSDLKGLKLRVPETPVYIDMFETWGATPVAMAFSELYTALQQGTVDGQDNGLNLTTDSKFGEVQKYFSTTNHAYGTGALACNDKTWAKLSADDQKIVKEAGTTMSENMRKDLRAARDGKVKTLKDAGVEVTELTDAQRAEFAKIKDTLWKDNEKTFGKEVIDGLRKASDEAAK